MWGCTIEANKFVFGDFRSRVWWAVVEAKNERLSVQSSRSVNDTNQSTTKETNTTRGRGHFMANEMRVPRTSQLYPISRKSTTTDTEHAFIHFTRFLSIPTLRRVHVRTSYILRFPFLRPSPKITNLARPAGLAGKKIGCSRVVLFVALLR
jgi:hypothetical protein